MLRSVLADYLSNVKEREFDLPFLTLLPRLGFYDLHFTHGSVEFGKDFIAKRIEDGVALQYSFQVKAGDISQTDWRTTVMGQMLESILTGLTHPNFDRLILRQAVLVTTGRLLGNAALGLQDLNREIKETYGRRPVDVWDQETLIDFLRSHSIEGIYAATASGFAGYGDFYTLYGGCLQGVISEEEIERHSRQWLIESILSEKRLICAATEAEIIAQKCQSRGLYYEATFAHLGAIRTILHEIQSAGESNTIDTLVDTYHRAMESLHSTVKEYISLAKGEWANSGKDLVSLINGTGAIIVYLVQCARITQITGWAYFMERDSKAKQEMLAFLKEFIVHEPGCGRIPSENHVVSLVFPVLALLNAGEIEDASQLIRRSTVWMCDRYQEGRGLASYGSNADDEIVSLFGHPFEFFPEEFRRASFLATVLSDLAAFVGNKELYANVVNDIKAVRIFPEYWQVDDSEDLYDIEGKDIVSYPNIEYNDNLGSFEDFRFAEHIIHERRSFRICATVGAFGLMTMMLLLRDRYFPTLWPLLMEEQRTTQPK